MRRLQPCPHGKLKLALQPHASCASHSQVQAPDPEVKPEVKLRAEIKQEPFTVRGYFGLDEQRTR